MTWAFPGSARHSGMNLAAGSSSSRCPSLNATASDNPQVPLEFADTTQLGVYRVEPVDPGVADWHVAVRARVGQELAERLGADARHGVERRLVGGRVDEEEPLPLLHVAPLGEEPPEHDPVHARIDARSTRDHVRRLARSRGPRADRSQGIPDETRLVLHGIAVPGIVQGEDGPGVTGWDNGNRNYGRYDDNDDWDNDNGPHNGKGKGRHDGNNNNNGFNQKGANDNNNDNGPHNGSGNDHNGKNKKKQAITGTTTTTITMGMETATATA